MVTATVNSMLMNTGTQYFWSEIFNVIQRACGVQCHVSAYGVMITGRLSQVTRAGDILQLRWRKLYEDLRLRAADQGQRGANFNQPDANFDQRDSNFQQRETNFNQRENFYPVAANSIGSSFGRGISFNSMGHGNQPPTVTKQPAGFGRANINSQQYGNRPNLSPGYIARSPYTNVTEEHGIEQPISIDCTSNLESFENHLNIQPGSIDRSSNSNMEIDEDSGSTTCSPDVKPKTSTEGARYSQPVGNPSIQNQPSHINRLPNSDIIAGHQDNESKTHHPNVNSAPSTDNARYFKTCENPPNQQQPSNMDKFQDPNAMRRDQVSETRTDPPTSKPLTSTDRGRSSEPSGNPSIRHQPSKTSEPPNLNTMEKDQVSESRTSHPHVNAENSTKSAKSSQPLKDLLKRKESDNVHKSCNSNTTGRDKASETRTETPKRRPLSTDSAKSSQPLEDPLKRKESGNVHKPCNSNTTDTDKASETRTEPPQSFEDPSMRKVPGDIYKSCNSNMKEKDQYSESGMNPPEDKRATSPDSTKKSLLLNEKQNGVSIDTTIAAENTTPTMQDAIPHGKKKTSKHSAITPQPSVSLAPNISTQAKSSTVSWSASASDNPMDHQNEKLPSSPGSNPSPDPTESDRPSSTPKSSTGKKISKTSGDQVESPSNDMAGSESERPTILSESTKDHQQTNDHHGSTKKTAAGADNVTTISNPLQTQSNEKPEFPDEESQSLPKTMNAPPQDNDQLGTDPITEQNSGNSNNDDESPLDDQPWVIIKKPPADSATNVKPLSDDETATTQNPAIGSLSSATSDHQNGKSSASTLDSAAGEQSDATENLPSNKQQHQNTPDQISKQQVKTHEQGNVVSPPRKSPASKNQIPRDTVEQTQNSKNIPKMRTPVPLPRKKTSGTNERRQNAATFVPPAKQPGHDSPTTTEPDTSPLNGKPVAATESKEKGGQEGTTQNPKISITTEERDENLTDQRGHDSPTSTEPDTSPLNGKPVAATESKEKGGQEGTTQNPKISITTEERDENLTDQRGHDSPTSTEPDTIPSNGKPVAVTESKEKGEQEGTTQNTKTSITTEERDENLIDQLGNDSPTSAEADTNAVNGKPVAATESKEEGEDEGTTKNPKTSITTKELDEDKTEQPENDSPTSTEPDTNAVNGKPAATTKFKKEGEQEGTTQNPKTSITTEELDDQLGNDSPTSTEPDTSSLNGKPDAATESKKEGEQEGTAQNPKTPITTEELDDQLGNDTPTSTEPDTSPLNGKSDATTESKEKGEQESSTQNPKTLITKEQRDENAIDFELD